MGSRPFRLLVLLYDYAWTTLARLIWMPSQNVSFYCLHFYYLDVYTTQCRCSVNSGEVSEQVIEWGERNPVSEGRCPASTIPWHCWIPESILALYFYLPCFSITTLFPPSSFYVLLKLIIVHYNGSDNIESKKKSLFP